MPNTYLKTEQMINAVFAELLDAENLTGLITPWDGDRFVGAKNDTLTYRTKPVTIARDYEFRTRTRPVIFDEIYRNTLQVKIDQHMTVGNRWTDEERKFDLQSFRTEIAAPMGEAMVTRFDRKILAALKVADWAVTDLNVTEGAAGTETDQTVLKNALKLKAKLDAVGTPRRGRKLILGSNPFLYFAGSKAMLAYDTTQARNVFQQGVAGSIAGFDIVDGTQILGENEIIAVHPTWAVLPNCAPEAPIGAEFSDALALGGYSARLTAQYHQDWASNALLMNTFWGVSEIKDQFARHTTATAAAAKDGSEAGDVIVVDGVTTFTGKNARGGKGTFTPAA